jgi:hypothetical protein
VITQDELSLYLDGEATAARAREIETALQADPDLRARLDGLRRNDLNLKSAMDRVLERPVPDRLAESVRAALASRAAQPVADNVVPLKPRARVGRAALWPSAIAAALVGGVMIGHFAPIGAGPQGDWTSDATGAPQAGKAMAAALSSASSGAHVTLASGRAMTPVMTFASRDGGLCRQFDVDAAGARRSGLACRDDHAAWRLVAMAQAASPATGSGYRTAAGPGDDAVSAMADRLIKGEPMDAAAEAAALKAR